MDKDVALTLRIPPRLKDAIAELAALGVVYRGESGEPMEIRISTVNQFLTLLVAEGVGRELATIEKVELGTLQDRFQAYRQMMEFVMKHPDVRRVSVKDFPEGSLARSCLAAKDKGASRVDVTNEYARLQERLDHLAEAKVALAQAFAVGSRTFLTVPITFSGFPDRGDE